MSFNRILTISSTNLRKSFTHLNSKKNSKTMTTLEQIIANNNRNEEIITSMQRELVPMRGEIIARRKKALRLENAVLQKQVEAAKAQLVALELRNGKRQIPVPGARTLCTDATASTTVPTPATNGDVKATSATTKPAKEKKPKKENPAAATAAPTQELPIDVGRLDMRVGKIIQVDRHPDADSLYLEKIDCGEPQPRTVVSGLVKYIPLEEMQNRMVVVLCNLKPAKMRGVTSEAMVMCASSPEKIEILSPPAGAVPGDLVHCEGYTRQPDAQLNPKKKVFETCAPDLLTNGELVACYKGAALHVPGKGTIVAQTLKNVNVK